MPATEQLETGIESSNFEELDGPGPSSIKSGMSENSEADWESLALDVQMHDGAVVLKQQELVKQGDYICISSDGTEVRRVFILILAQVT